MKTEEPLICYFPTTQNGPFILLSSITTLSVLHRRYSYIGANINHATDHWKPSSPRPITATQTWISCTEASHRGAKLLGTACWPRERTPEAREAA